MKLYWLLLCVCLVCNGYSQTVQKDKKDTTKNHKEGTSMKRESLIILSEKSTFQHFQVNYKTTKTAEEHLILLQDAIKLVLGNPKFIEDKSLLYFFILENCIKTTSAHKDSVNNLFLGYAPYYYLYKSDHFRGDFRVFWNKTMEPLLKSMNQEKFNQALKPILLAISDPFMLDWYNPFFLMDRDFFEKKLYKVPMLNNNDIINRICLYIKNGSFDGYEYAEVFLVSVMYSLQNSPEKEAIFNGVEKRFVDLDKLKMKGQELMRLMLYYSAKRYGKRNLEDDRETYSRVAYRLYNKFYQGDID